MASIVLVHGAWGGGWVWRDVLDPLRAAGHRVHAVTLTGVGERAHLFRPDIGLSTHVQDVLGLVRSEELSDIVLVGNSYGGMVITGAADRLLADDAQAVRSLVYVDAIVPRPGEPWSGTHDATQIQQRRDAAAAHGGGIPPADPKAFGLDGAQRDWVLRRQVPQPLATYLEPLDFDAARIAARPRLFIDCTTPALPTIAASRQRVHTEPGWTIVEMATGHCPQFSAPQAFVRHLLDWLNRHD